ncbi:hypothetical protein HDU93_006354, partial [Gonapodya sp. JEL0774]
MADAVPYASNVAAPWDFTRKFIRSQIGLVRHLHNLQTISEDSVLLNVPREVVDAITANSHRSPILAIHEFILSSIEYVYKTIKEEEAITEEDVFSLIAVL